MTARHFLDTNIAIYAYDSSDAVKQNIAQQVLRDHALAQTGVISVQVLGEFFHATVTRKKLLDVSAAQIAISALRHLQVVPIEEAMVDRAITLHQRYQLRYWDALIVAAAKFSGCAVVISEDLDDAQDYDGVAVVNPFVAHQP